MRFVGIQRRAFPGLVLCVTYLCSCAPGLGGSRSRESITLRFLVEGDALAWDVGYSAGDQVQSIDEFVRRGQTVENWTEMVTVQTFNKAADLDSVDEAMAAHYKDLVARCPGSTLDVIRRPPNGALYESGVVNCQQGDDEHVLARMLDGTLNRFLVQYTVRGAVTMTPERRTEWIEKLMAVEIMNIP